MTAGSSLATPAAARARAWERLILPAMLAVFFLSGISGLIYQVVWVRMLSLTFGVTSFAIATVLSGFMAGLALGAFLSGRLSDRLTRPLAGYATVEILIGLAGVLSPLAFAAVRALYVGIVDLTGLSALLPLSLLRFGLAFLVLLVPTTLMGATLPLMVRSSLLQAESISRNISLLYALNTLGAAAGAFAAGFFLIGRFGLTRTLVLAAAINVLAGLLAFALGRLRADSVAAERAPAAPVASERPYPAAAQTAVFAVFAVSGGLSLAYEVVWARVLAIFFDATTYGYTIMLTMVLIGIGFGSWLISPVINRRLNWLAVFAAIEAAVGVLGLLAVPLLANVVPVTERLGLYADPGPLGQFSIALMAVVSALVVLPPMFLLGMSFPIAARVVGTGQPDVGRRVGAVYAGNVFGGIVGAFVGGFILLPQLGVARSLLLLGAGSMTLAIVLAWAIPMRRTWWRPVAVGAGALAVLLGVVLAPDLYAGIFQKRFLGQQVVLIDEGLENMAAVTDFPDTGERKLYLNGQPQASTTPLVANFHQLLGHLGMLVHPRPRDALVIGLGGGATPGALAQHSGVDVDVVELSGAVTRAAPLFGAINGNVVDRPNVSLKLDDGRNFLLLTDKRYDVITADIIRPRHAGANNLYSVEYYELAKRALKDDGLMVQWFEQLSEQQYKLLLRSFVDVFPYVSLWANGAIAIGSKSPIAVDPAALAARFDDPAARASLAAIGLTRPEDVLGLYVGNRDDALVYLGPGPVISDDRPYVEYYRSLPAGDRLPDVSGFPRDPAAIVRR